MQEAIPFLERASVWQIVSAVLAFWAIVATFATAYIGSRMSAYWQNNQERKRLKLYVFGHILQDRANPANIDVVRAYNLIDALFHDTKSVRDKWQDYYDSLGDSRLSSDEGTRIRDDKRTELLRAMAEDIGMGKDFSSVEFSRVYWPEGLEQERSLQLLQQQVTRHDLVERLNQQSLGGQPGHGL